ncbi:unnamed protein product, partial [Rhizoctonia solani]
RHPDLNQRVKWSPVWEAASNMAWALAWDDRCDKAENSPVSPSGAREIQMHGNRPHTETGATQTPNPLDIHELTRIILGLFNRSQVEVANPNKDSTKPDLQRLSKVAWTEVYNSYPDMDQHGREAFEALKTEIGKMDKETSSYWQDRYVKVFKSTMEATWRNCWEKTWEKVMNDTLSELDGWKRSASTDTRNTAPNFNADIRSLESYTALQHYLKGTKLGENYWSIRSAFKASNLLNRVLDHSITLCYERVMSIRYFPDRPYDVSTPNPGSKFEGLAKVMQQDREEPLTYKQLQELIQRLACTNRYRGPRFPDKYAPIEKMEAIWKKSDLIDRNPNFMISNDTKQTLSGRKSQIKPSFQKTPPMTLTRVRARYMWEKLLSDLGARKHNPQVTTSAQSIGIDSAAENAQT